MTVYFAHLRTITVTLCIISMFTEATSTVTVIFATGFSSDGNQTESTSNTDTTNGTPPSIKMHSVMLLVLSVLIAYAGKQL